MMPSSPSTSDTSTNSLRPSSDGTRIGTLRVDGFRRSGGRPAKARITGATKAWKVKIAEVGNPGSTTTGFSPRPQGKAACRVSALRHAPECRACRAARRCDARGRRRLSRCRRDSTSMSHSASALRIAASRTASSSGNAPNGNRLAARFRDGGGNDGAIAVIDAGRTQRLAGLHQFVAGREHGDVRLAHDLDRRRVRRPPACRFRASRSACRCAAGSRRARYRSRHKTMNCPGGGRRGGIRRTGRF